MPTCPSCHRDQVQSSAFCAYCGAVLDRPASSGSPPDPTATATISPSHVPPPTASAAPGPSRTRAKLGSEVRHETGDVGAYIVRRLIALLVDIVVVGGLIAITAHAWVKSVSPGGMLTPAGFVQLIALAAVALFVYRWLFEGLFGTTLGKLIVGLGVGRRDGGSAGLVRAFVRNLLLPVDLALVGFLLAALTPLRRRLGDFAAGTVVANSRIGALAPLVGALVLCAAGYAAFTYSGGIENAQNLGRDAMHLVPWMGTGPQPSPAATVTPAPIVPTPRPNASAV